MSKKFGINGVEESTFDNLDSLKTILNNFLRRNDYKYSDPDDLSVHFNSELTDQQSQKKLRRF